MLGCTATCMMPWPPAAELSVMLSAGVQDVTGQLKLMLQLNAAQTLPRGWQHGGQVGTLPRCALRLLKHIGSCTDIFTPWMRA